MYPAIFTPDAGNQDNAYNVIFPDFDNCFTCGYGIDHSYEMAAEVLGICIESFIEDMGNEPESLPMPSNPNHIQVPDGGFVTLVQVDMADFFYQIPQ
jgi:predicted RNase H-like HicB family nuclease